MRTEDLDRAVRRRIGWIRHGLVGCLLLLVGYLFDLQVLQYETYRQAAERNQLRKVRVVAARGLILDREGRVLVKNRPSFDLMLVVDRVTDAALTAVRAGELLGLDDAETAELGDRLRQTGRAEIRIAEDLTLAQVAAVEVRALEWPEFRVREGLVRRYPHGTVAAHALGHMGEIRERQLAADRYRDYRPGEVIGQTGVEASYESRLRGADGRRWVQVDSRGRVTRRLRGIQPPQPGADLVTTLDLDVQEAAEKAFAGHRGAAVAIDPHTGAVLALVSQPAYDPNVFSGKLSGDLWKAYREDPDHPLFHRALRATVPPGSVFKIVNSIAGLEEGLWDPYETLTCRGHTVLHHQSFACWRAGGHGPVDLRAALRGSCNVYFYHRGDEAGIESMARWARALGLGAATGIDIPAEAAGTVPDSEWKRRTYGEPWWPGETVSVAIGQGALQVTVLQIATMMEVVANGGVAYRPYLVERVAGDEPRAAERIVELKLSKRTLALLRDALWAVVNEQGGTARRARLAGYGVTGKTGTAQAPDGARPEDRGEHAWFTGYAPGEDPQVVAAVLIERGGHGGETAAPVARAIFETVIRKRGIEPYQAVPAAVVAAAPPDQPAATDEVVMATGLTATQR